MPPNHLRLAEQGREASRISLEGAYDAPSGRRVELRDAIDAAKAGTQSYPPDRAIPPAAKGQGTTEITVTNETTLSVTRWLVLAGQQPVALNFASARHPGGGYLGGAQAQEESLARASALVACIDGDPMYAWHEAHRNPLYTDSAIYSPAVPVFRGEDGELLEEPYVCAFITSPAVNAGVALRQDPTCGPAIHVAMARRIELVLAIAAAHGHIDLVLGAWGCGVFANDPHEIATLFRDALIGPYRDVFARVVFAVLDHSPSRTVISPFERAFNGG